MMQVRILRRYLDQANHEDARRAWCDLIELRQRSYREQHEFALILDKYDLIADHVLLYSESGTLMGYVRSLNLTTVQSYREDLPLQILMKNLAGAYAEAFSHFENQCRMQRKTVLNMSYLCLDYQFKSELGDFKLLDFLTWIAMRSCADDPRALAYCATPNAKYKLSPWLHELGDGVTGLPRFIHPVIPEDHEVVLLHSVHPHAYQKRAELYSKYFDDAIWLIPAFDSENKAA